MVKSKVTGVGSSLDTNLENDYLAVTGDADGTYPFELSNGLINIFNLSKLTLFELWKIETSYYKKGSCEL